MESFGARELDANASRYQPLVFVLVAVSVGIAADRFCTVSFGVWISAGTGGLFLWLVSRRWIWQTIVTAFLLTALIATGGSWHHLHWRLFRADDLSLSARIETQPACIEGVALASPRIRPAPPEDLMRTMPAEEQSVLTIHARRVRDGNTWQRTSGRVNIMCDGELQGVRAGDRLRIFGLLSSPSRALNPGEFDFAAHQRRRRELCRINCDVPECISVIKPASFRRPVDRLQQIRDRGDALLWKHLRHDRAGLAAAVLLGMREQVDPERMQDFMTTGTVHLLAISGLHVGILAAGFWFLARFGWLSRRKTLLMAIGLVVFYAALTDARPPVVRAAVLISVMCVARLLGRRALEFNTLAVAGLIVLAMNPTNLFQTGTQLSFLAVATLACSQQLSLAFVRPEDPLDRLISQSRPFPIRIARRCGSFFFRLWLASMIIWLIALPLVMYRFHLFSPIAVLLNPIVWLPMGLALFSGFGVLMFGWWLPLAADASGWVCDQSLSFIELCIQAALSLPISHAWTPSPPLWWVVGFYAALASGVATPRLRPARGWCVVLAAAWFAVGFAFTTGPLSRSDKHDGDELVCTFVAVGHGTSVLVELPDGRTLLYDAGRLGSSKSGVRPISSLVWSRGITHFDAIVISHADADHYNSLPGLLERCSVGAVYVSPLMFREESPALAELRAAIATRGVPLRELDSTGRLDGGDEVELDVLHPPPRGVIGSDNANSIVLRVSYAGHTILLPGDLETPGLEDVMAELPLDSDVVMAPHHGSMRSDPRGFSAWSTPEWVVISGGHGRDLRAVKSAYAEGGATVLHTSLDGAIQIKVSKRGLRIAHWTGAKWQAASETRANPTR